VLVKVGPISRGHWRGGRYHSPPQEWRQSTTMFS